MIGRHALATAVQLADIDDSLHFAHGYSTAARLIESDLALKRGLRTVKFAFLNRACELACVPLAQHYTESSNGLDLVWVTYRPEAIANSPGTDPAALVYLGSVDILTEDQARSRAIG